METTNDSRRLLECQEMPWQVATECNRYPGPSELDFLGPGHSPTQFPRSGNLPTPLNRWGSVLKIVLLKPYQSLPHSLLAV